MSIPVVSQPFAPLNTAKFINLTTFLRTGAAVPTPVWFAELHGVLYVRPGASAGKVNRIRHTARIAVAPCTRMGAATGPSVKACTPLVSEEGEARDAEQSLARKYGIVYSGWFGVRATIRMIRRIPSAPPTYIAVEPAH